MFIDITDAEDSCRSFVATLAIRSPRRYDERAAEDHSTNRHGCDRNEGKEYRTNKAVIMVDIEVS